MPLTKRAPIASKWKLPIKFTFILQLIQVWGFSCFSQLAMGHAALMATHDKPWLAVLRAPVDWRFTR
jgi:hypothetical protein